jgi:tetraacyldisaccharide 4'-kinase
VLFQSGVAPVYVARNRADGAQLIEQDAAGTVIILDDGFQHRALNRDVDIVSVYVGSEGAIADFCRGRLLPLGRFRESIASGLRRADIVIATERRVLDAAGVSNPIDSRLLSLLPVHIKAYRSSLEGDAVKFLSDGRELRPRAVIALAAIANPDGFFASLRTLGFHLLETVAFRDHHFFTEGELRAIAARHPDVPIVCTVKDGVKLREMPADLLQLIASLDVRAKVFPADAFAVQLVRALQMRPQTER